MKHFRLLLLATLIASGACHAQGPAERIRHLDGVITASEAELPTHVVQEDAGRLVIHQDARFLSIAVQAEALDVASLCLAAADTVLVLHASAALGALTYSRQEETWRTGDHFAWAMRDTSMTDAAQDARRAHLNAHGWVATTMRMGRPGEVEFLIRRTLLPPGDLFLAAGLMPSARPEEMLALPAETAGDCADFDLVAGSPSSTYRFQPTTWVLITDSP